MCGPATGVLEAIDREGLAVERLDMSGFLAAERWINTARRNRAGLNLSGLSVTADAIRFSNPRSRPLTRHVPVGEDLCPLMGYYIAEGAAGHHRRDHVLAPLMERFGSRAGRVDRYIEQDWAAEPWSGGCYMGMGHCPPGVLTPLPSRAAPADRPAPLGNGRDVRRHARRHRRRDPVRRAGRS
jgi:hypothetical protein